MATSTTVAGVSLVILELSLKYFPARPAQMSQCRPFVKGARVGWNAGVRSDRAREKSEIPHEIVVSPRIMGICELCVTWAATNPRRKRATRYTDWFFCGQPVRSIESTKRALRDSL